MLRGFSKVAVTAAVVLMAAPVAASAAILPGQHQVLNRQDPVCLDVTDALTFPSAEVKVWRCVNAGNQRWERVPTPSGEVLRVAHSGLCLSVQWNGGQGYGSNVVQGPCSTADTWRFTEMVGGWTRISAFPPSGGARMCLDKAGWDVTVWSCHDGWWQQWQSLG